MVIINRTPSEGIPPQINTPFQEKLGDTPFTNNNFTEIVKTIQKIRENFELEGEIVEALKNDTSISENYLSEANALHIVGEDGKLSPHFKSALVKLFHNNNGCFN